MSGPPATPGLIDLILLPFVALWARHRSLRSVGDDPAVPAKHRGHFLGKLNFLSDMLVKCREGMKSLGKLAAEGPFWQPHELAAGEVHGAAIVLEGNVFKPALLKNVSIDANVSFQAAFFEDCHFVSPADLDNRRMPNRPGSVESGRGGQQS